MEKWKGRKERKEGIEWKREKLELMVSMRDEPASQLVLRGSDEHIRR